MRSKLANGRGKYRSLCYPRTQQSTARWVGVPMHSPCRSFAAVKLSKDQVPKKKKRLDEVCLERYEQYSQTYVQSWFLQVADVFQWRDKKLSRASQQLISRETNPL